MKIIIFLFLAITIIFQQAPKWPVCDIYAAQRAVKPRIFFEKAIDGKNQPVFITRFFHNKIGIFASEVAKCYFKVIEPNAMYAGAGIFGVIFEIYLAYKLVLWKKWYILIILLLLPFAPFFNIFENQIYYMHKLFALFGLAVFAIKK